MSNPFRQWMTNAAAWLTPRRLRAQAAVLAICLWGVCAVDFATPGAFDRAGNIKFQDFLPFYIAARQIREHRSANLYDANAQVAEIRSIVGDPGSVRVPYLYGPQVGLLFVPLAGLSFAAAARVWIALTLLLYAACIFLVWRCCDRLRPHGALVALVAVAFPPLFHVFVRGQISVLVLIYFTTALLALLAKRPWLAGIAFGCLVFKPQFLVAIPLVFLLAGAWRILAGTVLSAGLQLGLTQLVFGRELMASYIDLMLRPARWIGTAELAGAPIQMHSLRAFWTLLLAPPLALGLYGVSAIAVIVLAVAVWRSGIKMPLKFAALSLAAVLVNPHLFIYDLLTLAPAMLLLANWATENLASPASSPLIFLTYLSFVLPLFGPVARWTHVQLSVMAFVALLAFIFSKRNPTPINSSTTEAIGR